MERSDARHVRGYLTPSGIARLSHTSLTDVAGTDSRRRYLLDDNKAAHLRKQHAALPEDTRKHGRDPLCNRLGWYTMTSSDTDLAPRSATELTQAEKPRGDARIDLLGLTNRWYTRTFGVAAT